MIRPAKGYILVELKDDYEHIAVTEAKYETKTKGKCIDAGTAEDEKWVGRTVYWESYKDDTRVGKNKNLCFIKLEYVMGYEEVDDDKDE